MLPKVWVDLGPVARRNLIANPSFETGTHGVLSGTSTTVNINNIEMRNEVGVQNLSVVTAEGATSSSSYVAQRINLPPHAMGKWVGFSLKARRSTGPSWGRLYASFVPSAVGSTNMAPLMALPSGTMKDNPRYVGAAIIPTDTDTQVSLWFRLHSSSAGNAPTAGVTNTDAWMAVIADTEAEALAGAATYFDGDTFGCRWEGTPHASPSIYDGPGWYPATGMARVWNGSAWVPAPYPKEVS